MPKAATPMMSEAGKRLNKGVSYCFTAAALVMAMGLSACNAVLDKKQTPSSSVEIPADYVEGKLTPPSGKTLMLIGQDIDTVSNFVEQTKINPAGVTAYVAADGTGAFQRFEEGHGDLDLQAYINGFPDSVLGLGVWMVGLEERMANPQDQLRKRFIRVLEALKASNRPVYMRLGYEVDGPWNKYDPKSFVDAWRFIATWVKENNADNIAMVWQLASYCGVPQYGPNTYQGADYDQWWPGDEYVDWVGFSYFSQAVDCPKYKNEGGLPAAFGSLHDTNDNGESQSLDNIMAYLISKNKPVLIAEATPVRYHLGDMTYKATPVSNVNDIVAKTSDEIWAEWYEPFFAFLDKYKHSVRAVSYINMEWSEFSSWACDPARKISAFNCAEGYWGNANILLDEKIKQRFFQKVNTDQYLFKAEDQSFSDYVMWPKQ